MPDGEDKDTPGAGDGAGRSKGAGGQLMKGGRQLHGGGTNFDHTSSHNQRDDRFEHAKRPSDLNKETLTAEKKA